MNWALFPLYGLTITEPNAWVDDPIFGDATIVSREAFEDYLKVTLGDRYHPLFAHGKLSDDIDISSVGLPVDQLLEVRPTSYIAVRDRSDVARNRRRATEIRGLLSSTMALRGLRPQTFASEPAQIAWFIAARDALVRSSEAPQASSTPVFNEHVLLKRLDVSQANLRQSFKTGSAIANNLGWYWDIYEAHPVCKLFLSEISKFQKRLLNAALQVQEAGCAPSYVSQVQMTVAAFEVLLKPESFSELRSMVVAFFQGEEQVKRVESLLSMRHRLTHEGIAKDDPERVKETAQHGLMLAWTMVDIATAFDSMGLTTTFDDYIRLLIDAADLDERFGRLGEASTYTSALREKIPKFHKRLTLKVDFPDKKAD